MAVHIFIIILFAAVGLLCILAGAFGWKWFMDARNASFVVRLLGVRFARVAYCIMGLLLVVMAVVIARSVGLLH